MALSGSILLFEKFSDCVGHMKVCMLGFLIFLISSILCGLSQEIWQLILFRAIQATSAALITTLVSPENRNHALGTLGVMIELGPILAQQQADFLFRLEVGDGFFD
ncbi:MFS transporter [Bacillus tropicus]|uniref:MFS transporter n=1 Tax=Bacillus tropicus TaxID=2026188 RepID=UPI0035D88FFB